MKVREVLREYEVFLFQRELKETTIKTYLKQAELFLKYLNGRTATKNETIYYKAQLLKQNKKVSSINLYIVAVNSYLKYAGLPECVIKTNRIQKRQCPENVISIEEYQKMIAYTKEHKKEKYYCIIRALALTGVRVSELSGCTVESLKLGKFTVNNKGKSRDIYLPEKLVTDLSSYCMAQGIRTGTIFLGNKQTPISRTAVYKMLVHIAELSGIKKEKAHPHSFRHLFALTYMQQFSNLFELADILGHSSLETTRIYTASSMEEKRKRMNYLGL